MLQKIGGLALDQMAQKFRRIPERRLRIWGFLYIVRKMTSWKLKRKTEKQFKI
jgi:hypothetical protein